MLSLLCRLLALSSIPTVGAGAPPGPESVINDAGSIRVGTGARLNTLFYWLFESRNDPQRDPLIFWLSGGPGCSSILALFAENGPYKIKPKRRWTGDPSKDLEVNQYSWNANATVIWVDQPAGTGFSTGVPPHNEFQVADDFVVFLKRLARRYPQYDGREFFIFGESYAGHYVPRISAEIVARERAWASQDGPMHRSGRKLLPWKFAGCAIGNGLTNPVIQYRHYIPFVQAHNLVNDQQLALMRGVLPLCEALAEGCNVHLRNASDPAARALEWTACMNAYIFCNLGELVPVQSTGVNVYDIRRKCDPEHRLCYDFDDIEAYLEQDQVREALGVVKPGPWQQCRPLVDLALVYGGDWMKGYEDDVVEVLEAGVPVLIYAGDQDFICNYMGNSAWTKALIWSGTKNFHRAEETSWITSDGVEAGSYRSAKGLTFLRVSDAGHMVPMDQPAHALDMVITFTSGGFKPTSHSMVDSNVE